VNKSCKGYDNGEGDQDSLSRHINVETTEGGVASDSVDNFRSNGQTVSGKFALSF
jgi:hypothetical protein